MTVIKRRPRKDEPEPTGPKKPIRMQDAVVATEVPGTFGVDPEAAKRALTAYLSSERPDKDRPYCICSSVKGWSFDPQVGVYLHAIPACWKPSKSYYEAAVRAGVLGVLEMS